MRRAILAIVLILGVIGAVLLWKTRHGTESKAAEEKPAEEGSHLTHDETGRVVVKMDDETQGNLGLLVEKSAAGQQNPELKGYGKVLDPGALVALITEVASAQAGSLASSNELARLKTLAAQQNASERALQTAQATALRDQLTLQSAKDRLSLTWGPAIAERTRLPEFIESFTTLTAVLVRVDVPVGDALVTQPKGARISTLSGKSTAAEFLGTTANVDPQTLGHGAIFLIKPNTLGLLIGEAVIGYLELPGDPATGVIIPARAVVRTEGRGWIYVMNSGGDAFTRNEVALDHPVPDGWFVSKGVTTNDYVVVTGAQTLLSEEMKASLKAD